MASVATAQADVSFSIGINVPVYPQLVLVPGYPVYYDPRANLNYFFYDGLYWVYKEDSWYTSSWYNGSWELTDPEFVPYFVLRIPVRYYRQPPMYFRGWYANEPPHWGEHWGRDWESRRYGWDSRDRHSAPRAAPLPAYQKQYSGDRYPQAEERQHAIRSENYRYQPSEEVTRERYQQWGEQDKSRVELQNQAPRSAPAPQDRGQSDNAKPQDNGQGGRAESQRQRQQVAPQGQGDRVKLQNNGQRSRNKSQKQRPQAAPQERGQGERVKSHSNEQGNRHQP